MTEANLDPTEIKKFSDHANQWWDPQGELKTLHAINPLRVHYIQSKVPLAGKKVLDIGCGGGILAESLAKLGAEVTAIDMSEAALEAAKQHQTLSGTHIDYLLKTAEAIASERPAQYDLVTCLELLEHVPAPGSIIQAAAAVLKPGATVFFSTLNRTLKSYLFAIIGAEYILKLLPKNTHDYAKFIRPSELAAWGRDAGLTVVDMMGLHYHPISKQYTLNPDTSVNYLIQLIKQ